VGCLYVAIIFDAVRFFVVKARVRDQTFSRSKTPLQVLAAAFCVFQVENLKCLGRMAGMICPKCGYAMDAFDKTCPRCQGKEINADTAPQVVAAAKPSVSAQAASPTPSNKVSPQVQARVNQGCGCMALLIFACLALLQLGKPTVQPVFDVPALVGKDINGVQASLGTPEEDDSRFVWPNGDDEHQKNWTRQRVLLLATYHSRTSQIVDLFIGTDDPSGATDDKGKLLNQGNLQDGDPRYTIEFVHAGNSPDRYTGVKIIPR